MAILSHFASHCCLSVAGPKTNKIPASSLGGQISRVSGSNGDYSSYIAKMPWPANRVSLFQLSCGLSVIRHYAGGARNVPVLHGTRATLEVRHDPSQPHLRRVFNQQDRPVLRAFGRHLMPRLSGQSSHGQVAGQARCCGLRPGPARSGRPVGHAWPVRAQALARTFFPQSPSAALPPS